MVFNEVRAWWHDQWVSYHTREAGLDPQSPPELKKNAYSQGARDKHAAKAEYHRTRAGQLRASSRRARG